MIPIYLAIAKKYEPTLLLPMGFGAILVNIPYHRPSRRSIGYREAVEGVEYLLRCWYRDRGLPLLIFVAIGAMIDFSPLFRNPSLLLFGAAAQFGIFMTMVLAALLGYDIREAASIGIIGARWSHSIVVASRCPAHAGAISVAATLHGTGADIQPPVIKLLTTRKERLIRMTSDNNKRISQKALIAFPIVITIAAGIIAPSSLALIGFLMLGNLIRECGVLNKLSLAAQNELSSLVTILLGITIASTMTAERFVRLDTPIIIGLGLFAFVFDTFGGVIFAKFVNLFRKDGNKINPMVGACGISAFPMSARVILQM